MCVCACAHAYVCTNECRYPQRPVEGTGFFDLLEVEFQVHVSHIVWRLGTKLLSLGRTVSAPNHQAILSSAQSAFWNLSAFHIDPERVKDSEKIITFCDHGFGDRCQLVRAMLENSYLYVIPSCMIVVLDTLVLRAMWIVHLWKPNVSLGLDRGTVFKTKVAEGLETTGEMCSASHSDHQKNQPSVKWDFSFLLQNMASLKLCSPFSPEELIFFSVWLMAFVCSIRCTHFLRLHLKLAPPTVLGLSWMFTRMWVITL